MTYHDPGHDDLHELRAWLTHVQMAARAADDAAAADDSTVYEQVRIDMRGCSTDELWEAYYDAQHDHDEALLFRPNDLDDDAQAFHGRLVARFAQRVRVLWQMVNDREEAAAADDRTVYEGENQ